MFLCLLLCPSWDRDYNSMWLELGVSPGIRLALCVWKKAWESEPRGWKSGWWKRPAKTPLHQPGLDSCLSTRGNNSAVTCCELLRKSRESKVLHKCCCISICLVPLTVNSPAFQIPLLGEKRPEMMEGSPSPRAEGHPGNCKCQR